MTRSELIQRLHNANPHLTTKDVSALVDTFFEEIGRALADGGRVELRGFGAWETREREARSGRNPRNGQAVDVPAKKVAYFRASKILGQRLNSSGADMAKRHET